MVMLEYDVLHASVTGRVGGWTRAPCAMELFYHNWRPYVEPCAGGIGQEVEMTDWPDIR
jgi:hypothetical protein